MSSTTDSEKSANEASAGFASTKSEMKFAKKEAREAKRASKQEMRNARRTCKKALKEAKKRFKAECKAAKRAWKETQKAHKKKSRAAETVQQDGQDMQEMQTNTADPMMDNTEEAAPAARDFNFPVEISDGRRLTISWNKTDDPHDVAAEFATQHHILADEVPAIIEFVEHANQVAGGVQACTDSPEPVPPATKMDVSDLTPTASPNAMIQEEKLQVLEQMGFPNREMNIELLAAHEGNIQTVLEHLL